MARVSPNPQPRHAILFAGSSIFHYWESLSRDMAPLPVVNQAFAGARMHSVQAALEGLVIAWQPRIVVYYCGSNDIEDGATAAAVRDGFARFEREVRAALPATRIWFVSINRAPQKEPRWPVVDAANQAVARYCAEGAGLGYIDVNPVLSDAASRPCRELFLEDGLHLRPEAYQRFTSVMKPVLELAWQEVSGGKIAGAGVCPGE